jgi:hypothetical protein
LAPALERELGSAAVVGRSSDGALDVEVPCANPDAFRSWLIGLGAHAEVLGPPAVREAFVAWLRAIAEQRAPA